MPWKYSFGIQKLIALLNYSEEQLGLGGSSRYRTEPDISTSRRPLDKMEMVIQNSLIRTRSSYHHQFMSPFLQLPTELIQYIAYLLATDADRIRLSCCCSALSTRILPAESHVWRKLFRDSYDDTKVRSIVDYKVEYEIRAITLPQKINFRDGHDEKQKFWLEVIEEMLIESLLPGRRNEPTPSKNLQRIREVLSNSDFLNRPASGYMMKGPDAHSDLFCAIQLYLTYLALDPSMSVRCLRSDYNIGFVYGYNDDDVDLFSSDCSRVILENALHIRNFWLRHLLNPDEDTFYSSYMDLPKTHRPKEPSKVGAEKLVLSSSWLGYESCICPLPESLSSLEESRQTCADLNGHMPEVEHITLQIEMHPDPSNWPDLFDEVIAHRVCEAEKRSYFRGIQIYHGSEGNRSIPVRGFIEPVSSGSLPDWHRICYVMYEVNREEQPLLTEDGGIGETSGGDAWLFQEEWPPTDLDGYFDAIYAYEGVVIPGDRMMIGQWKDMHGMQVDLGPFIFWD